MGEWVVLVTVYVGRLGKILYARHGSLNSYILKHMAFYLVTIYHGMSRVQLGLWRKQNTSDVAISVSMATPRIVVSLKFVLIFHLLSRQ